MENIINEHFLQLSTKASTIQGNNFTLQLYIKHASRNEFNIIELSEYETILRQSYSIPQTDFEIINITTIKLKLV